MVRVGAFPDGRYALQKICLETLVQDMADKDPRWVDPAYYDIGAVLLTKAAQDEQIYGQIVTGQVLTDPWEEAPHRPRIVKDWNQREKKQADELIAARHNSLASLPIWSQIERRYDELFAPKAPTYTIDDGPGGYHNISDAEMARRRLYVTKIDPKATPENQPMGPAPAQFFRRLLWKYRMGDSTPPGLPKGVSFPPVYTSSML